MRCETSAMGLVAVSYHCSCTDPGLGDAGRGHLGRVGSIWMRRSPNCPARHPGVWGAKIGAICKIIFPGCLSFRCILRDAVGTRWLQIGRSCAC
jgi:hypothetical protein